ncbi:MAG: peptidoglycan-binding protein [Clostridia bacterium]|nr:peptidoglycan-binding protein [Clostridia bacterium]
MTEYLNFDSPIRNLQVFLRVISGVYSEIPSVIPDGVYGNSTKEAVQAFQNRFSLNETGITDNSTWDAIVRVYREIETDNAPPNWVRIFPEAGLRTDNNSYTPTIYVIQTMLYSLSQRFSNIPPPSLSGIADQPTIESVKAIQYASGLNPDGNITKLFWDYLSVIYETYISTDRVSSSSNITVN